MSHSEVCEAPRPAAPQRSGSRGDLRKIGINPNYWYPVACAADVKKGKAHGATFAGEPIVIVRTESGQIYALRAEIYGDDLRRGSFRGGTGAGGA